MLPPLNLQRRSFEAVLPGSPIPLSYDLEETITNQLEDGASVMLFLNRLGFAREGKCATCHFTAPWTPTLSTCSRCGGSRIMEVALGIDGLLGRCRARWPRVSYAVVSARHPVNDQWISENRTAHGRILIATSNILNDRRLEDIPWSLVVVLGVDALRAHPSPTAGLQTLQLLTEIGERYARPTSAPMVIMTHTPELPLWDAISDATRRRHWYATELPIYRSVGLLDERHVTFRSEIATADDDFRTMMMKIQDHVSSRVVILNTKTHPFEATIKTPSDVFIAQEFRQCLQTLRGQWSVTVAPLP